MDVNPKKVASRIRAYRKAAGLGQVELAAKIDTAQSTISKWERGLDRPTGTNLAKLALALGIKQSDIIPLGNEDDTAPGRRVRVIGELSAGPWQEAIQWDESDQYEMPLVVPESMMSVPMNGFVVKGPSMNLLYPDGSIVYVAPIHAVDGPQNKDIVLVMRKDSHGINEATLKQYVVDEEGKKWLWPRSDHPEHQAPLNYLGKKRGQVEEVQVTGIVMAALTFARR